MAATYKDPVFVLAWPLTPALTSVGTTQAARCKGVKHPRATTGSLSAQATTHRSSDRGCATQ